MPYRIVGIYETGQGMEESGGVVVLEDAQTIAQKERKVSLFQVGLRKGADADVVIERIESLDKDVTVSTASGYSASEQWTDYLQGFAWGVSAIAILIGGLGMMSAMVMSVLERTREIGTLRAVGWSRWRVLRMILGEALLLSVIGGVFGVVLGTFLAWLVGQAPGVGMMLAGSVEPRTGHAGDGDGAVAGADRRHLSGVDGGEPAAGGGAALRRRRRHRSDRVSWRASATRAFATCGGGATARLLSAAGIGIGVGTLVMLGGLVEGLIGQLNGLAGSGGAGNITVMQREVADMSLSSLDERIVRQIGAMPEVKTVSPYMLAFISSPEMPMFLIGGLDPNSPAMRHYKLVEGRYVQRPNEIVHRQGGGRHLQGRRRRLRSRSTATAITSWASSRPASPTRMAAASSAMREAQRLMGRPRSVSFIFVDVEDPAKAEQVVATHQQPLPGGARQHQQRVRPEHQRHADEHGHAQRDPLLALLVGGIVVANTMIMSIFERTREIGTLRAVGWRRRRILGQMLLESLFLCLVAAVIGSLLGVGVVTLIAQAPYASQFVSATWSVDIFVTAFVTAGRAGHSRRSLSGLAGQQAGTGRGVALRVRCNQRAAERHSRHECSR